jgi:serine/threonine-protein kinase
VTDIKVQCPQCGTALDADARYCVACGAGVPAAPSAVSAAAVKGIKSQMLEHLRDATLGEYEILLELGSGGMATVFLAHDLQLDRRVAIKLMHPALLAGEDMVERFILEARTAAGLSHPNIIPIHAVKVQEDLLYFVMKYIEGRPLDSIIRAEAPLDADTVRQIVTQVADALAYAHRHGVIHRDIKPANIIISTDGHPILADFGIAKVADRPGLTMTGATIGTPTYMSPEQCDAEALTGASDQYSLGVTAFEMLTGRPPFEAPGYLALMMKHMAAPAPPIR